ncbi:MAG: baseplate J/gp47 family protein [Proteobacteria bacterium]|nr:baseplate J/gp47 family protein [Pseudomonadota bacterium]
MKVRANQLTNSHLHISDGRSQEKRRLPALEKDYFNVAELHFHTLLALAVEYARVLKFYNLEDREDGTWEHFFSLDETVVIATILAVDLDKLASGDGYKSYVTDAHRELIEALHAMPAKEIDQHMIAAYSAVSMLDKWLQLLAFAKSSIGIELRKVLESVITGLKKDIDLLGECLAYRLSYSVLEKIFSPDSIGVMPAVKKTKQAHPKTTDVDEISIDPMLIRSSFYAFIKAIEMVQFSAKKMLSASLISQDHEPAAGLLIAFLQLFEKLHHKINRFTLNYVDFYYDQVLKARPRSFVPDYVYLVIAPSKKNHTVLIPEGTEFLAGQDENKRDIVYTTAEDVMINDAAVSAIHTLFFKRDALNFPENSLCEPVVLNDRVGEVTRQLATGGWLNDVPVAKEDSPLDEDILQSYPLFGAPKKVEDTILVQHARIGFAIASKVLWLQEGRRTVCIRMQFTGAPEVASEQWTQQYADARVWSLEQWILQYAGAQEAALKQWSRQYTDAPEILLDQWLRQYACASETTIEHWLGRYSAARRMTFERWILHYASAPEMSLEQWIWKIAIAMQPARSNSGESSIQEQQAFFKVFRDMFIISLSTEDGWREIKEYLPSYSGVDRQQKENSLAITFFLPEDFPAVVPYDRNIHGDGYETQLPVVRLIQNPRSYLYPYGILSKLQLDRISIDVTVEGCRMLQLHNNIGQLSPLAPFTPFGPIPEAGSYFIAGCAEAAGKQLSDFNITVQWGGLPAGIGGFKTHYQGYENFSDTDFRVSTSVLVNGKWLPENAKGMAVDSLFRIKTGLDGGSEVSEYSELSCAAVISYWSPDDYRSAAADFGYTPSTNKGFFKFTLVAPQQAFGHRDYPTALANVLTFNAKQKHTKFFKQVPNPPYTPMITAISANYRACAHIVPGKEEAGCSPPVCEKVMHLHPLGWEDVTMQTDRVYHLLPQYEYSGNLLIGLNGLAGGGVVTLYFHLRENSLPVEHTAMQEIQWFYLANNRWLSLSTKEIIADSTHRFMKAGIVTLDIPADISQENTVLPAGLCWLRVSSDHNLEKYCSLYSIHSQALKASRYLHADAVISGAIRLPAGTVSRLRKSIPGIGGIKQIQPSFGGRQAEDRSHLRIRISERLRHKQRTLLPADYESLILEQFPQIYKVKCFPGMNPDFVAEQRFNPGHLLIAVVPYLTQNVISAHKPLLSGHLINDVADFIGRYAPSFATVHVINPVYEVIQVRCTVKLKNPLLAGMYLARLNQAISDFLSPWNETIGYTRHFGWVVSKHDIESFIQNLDYIDRVTNLSILRIAPIGEGFYDLLDSADKAETSEVKDIIPVYPWSIVAPIQQHFIELDDRYDIIEPQITGIGELEIGSTFIISDEKWREKIEKH